MLPLLKRALFKHLKVYISEITLQAQVANTNIIKTTMVFGPVLLGLTDVMRLCPALLGCAEEDLNEAPTLVGLQDGSQCTN